MRAFFSSLKHLARLPGSERRLLLPFLLTASFEAALLGLVWLAPQPPFSTVLAPPIRYFFSDRVLHYPLHLWFLYQVMKHTSAGAAIALGAFMSGIACLMVAQVHAGQPISFRAALMGGRVRYWRVVLIWLSTWGLAKGLTAGLIIAAPKGPATVWLAIALSIILQALLVYAIPAAVYEQRSWWRALIRSVQETLGQPLSTLLIVALPSAVVILFALMFPSGRVLPLMQRTEPEIALVFVVGRLVLWTVADIVMTVGVAHLWWTHRAEGEATAVAPGIPSVGQGSIAV